jgi:putative transposase
VLAEMSFRDCRPPPSLIIKVSLVHLGDLPSENRTTGNGRIRPVKGADSMRKSRFSEPPIVHILRQAEVGEKAIGQLCRDHGISVNTSYRWRRRYGGMGIPELRRQRHLEQENARLKRLLAERDLEVDALRDCSQ